jgi:hypothetical protein
MGMGSGAMLVARRALINDTPGSSPAPPRGHVRDSVRNRVA